MGYAPSKIPLRPMVYHLKLLPRPAAQTRGCGSPDVAHRGRNEVSFNPTTNLYGDVTMFPDGTLLTKSQVGATHIVSPEFDKWIKGDVEHRTLPSGTTVDLYRRTRRLD